MTVKVTVHCDTWDCEQTQEVESHHDSDVHAEGWHVDPHCGYDHYCPDCWEKKPAKEKEY